MGIDNYSKNALKSLEISLRESKMKQDVNIRQRKEKMIKEFMKLKGIPDSKFNLDKQMQKRLDHDFESDKSRIERTLSREKNKQYKHLEVKLKDRIERVKHMASLRKEADFRLEEEKVNIMLHEMEQMTSEAIANR